MTCLQASWLSSLNTVKTTISPAKSKQPSFKVSFSVNVSAGDEEPPKPNSSNSSETTEFRKSKESISESKFEIDENPDKDSAGKGNGNKEIPASVKTALERAKEYKNNKGTVQPDSVSGLEGGGNKANMPNNAVENKENEGSKKKELSVSGIDFVGLGFADKKKGRGLPAGLVPMDDQFPEGDIPEVEIIVGDTTKFGEATANKPKPTQEDNPDLYKPKVSTWGVFPRPGNISKTFGGGRVIRPGQVLETDEDRAAKEERTRQLIAAYKKKVGLNIDAKLKSECEKAMKDGNSMMDSGKLREALPYFQKVMDKLAFQTELHGLAALQWSICQDSLRRPNEARIMYEKLQSHPNATVSKKARQFIFSFQAMEMMKVTSSNLSATTTRYYQNYFDAFVDDKTDLTLQEAEAEEDSLSQTLPYVIFLASPILIVLFIAAQKGITS